MHISKRLLLLWAVASIAIHAFGQNAIDGQTTNDRESASSNQTLATYITGSITKPSPGQTNLRCKTLADERHRVGKICRVSEEDPGPELRRDPLFRYSDKLDSLLAKTGVYHLAHTPL